jgi:hypothetical protein
MLLLVGCGLNGTSPPPTQVPASAATPLPATATAPPATAVVSFTPQQRVATATPPAATAAAAPRLQTFHALVSFDTYETEETVQLQIGHLPGVASVVVTQLDITVQYDATRVTEDDILRTLRANPEVRIKDDDRAGR